MGNNESHIRNERHSSVQNNYAQLSHSSSQNFSIFPTVSVEQKRNNKLIKPCFHGVWSQINFSESHCPCARIGHFHTYDPSTGKEYIGYGLDENENTLNDVWSVDLIKRKWEKVKIKGYIPEARTGSSAVFSNGIIYIFGGYNRPKYFNDLHAIQVSTGECRQIKTSGQIPTPRTSPLIGYYNNKLHVWGGFDRTFPTELYTLDFNTLTWTVKETGLSGRTTAPYTIIGSHLYSYGSSTMSTVLHIDLKKGTIEEIPCIGACPPNTAQCAGMASTKETLFWFGGKTEADFGFLYAFDIKKRWWYVFQMRPDGESVKFSDGRVDELGLFQIPLIWSFSMQYERHTRELIGLFGFPMRQPPPLFIVSVGEALGVVHLRDDMLENIRTQCRIENPDYE